MRVLVTGATGFLGSHLVDLLLSDGARPRVLVRPGEPVPWPAGSVDVCRGDLSDRASLETAVDGIDRVLHCAARTGPWGPEREYQAANVTGLQLLLDAALGAGVGRIVHVSSITVHGNDVGGWADESAPLRSEPNPYSRSKVAGERLLNSYMRERPAPVVIVRPGWIYGPGDRASFARFAGLVERGQMPILGSGRNHLPLVYVRDVARGIVLASEAPSAAGRTYLLVNDEPVTQAAYLDVIAEKLGVASPTRHIPYRVALAMAGAVETAARLARRQKPPPLTRYGIQLLGGENRFRISRARSDLGFVPTIGLQVGVARSVEWYRGERRVPQRDREGAA